MNTGSWKGNVPGLTAGAESEPQAEFLPLDFLSKNMAPEAY